MSPLRYQDWEDVNSSYALSHKKNYMLFLFPLFLDTLLKQRADESIMSISRADSNCMHFFFKTIRLVVIVFASPYVCVAKHQKDDWKSKSATASALGMILESIYMKHISN